MRVAFLVSFLALSCSWIAQRKALAKCEFSLHSVKLVNADFQGFELEIGIKAKNPTETDAVLDKLDYSVFLEGAHLADGVVEKQFRIPTGGSQVIKTRVKVAYADLSSAKDAVMKAILKKEAKIRVSGRAHFGPLKVPFNLEEVRKF